MKPLKMSNKFLLMLILGLFLGILRLFFCEKATYQSKMLDLRSQNSHYNMIGAQIFFQNHSTPHTEMKVLKEFFLYKLVGLRVLGGMV